MTENEHIYLDHNATSPVHPEVAEEVMPFLSHGYGNPSAPYAAGREARERVQTARVQTARLLGCAPGEVAFTSGGTESNNLAIKGTFFARRDKGRKHIVTSAVEHPSVRETCAWLAGNGCEVTVVPVDHAGRVEPDNVEAALRPDTFLVSVMHANNEVGTLQPVTAIAELAHQRGITFHVDGVQAAGRIPVDVKELGCDLCSLSAHKFGGIKGTGALYVREGFQVEWVQQGGHQEGGVRAGTENVPGIVALGKAAEVALRDLNRNMAHAGELAAVFEELTSSQALTRLNGHHIERIPNTVNLCCLYADAMNVVLTLSITGLYIGTGSACASHTQEPSRVLRAMGLSEMAAYCSIRISTGPENTMEEAQRASQKLSETVEQLRLVTAPEDIGICDENCPCFFEEGKR
jgi:cysteine desulfurase